MDKTVLDVKGSKDILNATDLARMVFENCKVCKMAHEKFLTNQPGKVHWHHLLSARNHQQVVFIDLLTNIKLKAFSGQKVTPNTKTIKYHLMVCICSVTRYMTIAIVDHKDTSALAMALKVIFSRSGTPKIIFSDQESRIVTLAKWVS